MAIAIVLLSGTTAIASPFRVVIDAGHGGSNTGAPGLVAGAYEKRVTLAVARALADELRARGLDVVMTRSSDEYLTLRERVRRANAAEPDCFVSLHTNASGDRSRRGVETWVLARDAAEIEARRAASRERDEVRSMLRELELLDAARASAQLARALQSEVVAATGGQDRGVRQYGYDVLAGVTAPAVLVEMGFLDHPIEGAALLEPVQQHRIAAALASGIARFADDVRAPQKLVMSAAHDATRRPAP
ncbi:MAG: N-acetylmuramoyl-L-alanine amidase family protein [Polyangia bacterium]